MYELTKYPHIKIADNTHKQLPNRKTSAKFCTLYIPIRDITITAVTPVLTTDHLSHKINNAIITKKTSQTK